MATGGILSKFKILLPGRSRPKGTAITPTHDPSQPRETLSFPEYRDHLTDIYDSRVADNSQDLLKALFKNDPDISNTVWAFLTVADQEPRYKVVDAENQIDRDGMKILWEILERLTTRRDYTKGFVYIKTLRLLAEEIRHMLLMRGGAGVEAVYDELLTLSELRHVDMHTVRFIEPRPGVLQPFMETSDGKEIKLDFPTFFISFLRKPPTDAYGHSAFASVINTIAARQQVINDLYRIMQITGYPRIDVKILEEVVMQHAPVDVKADAKKRVEYLNAIRTQVENQFVVLRPDQPAVHFDSVELGTVNDKKPGMAVDISAVIKVLDAQNQAGLHTMATILGRGESGVNTATVEARIFAMNAEALNKPVAEILSQILTQALRFQGSESRVEVTFNEVELRPDLELEPNRTMKSSRLRQDLSDGLITDDEYHIAMYGRLRPDSSPELSGTGFMTPQTLGVDEEKVSPNSDPLGRSVSSKTNKQAKSNSVK